MLPSAVLSHHHWNLYGVCFSSAFHSSIANLCVGFSFYGFTTATAKGLPTDWSVSSSLQQEKTPLKIKISSAATHRDLSNKRWEDREAVITLCTLIYGAAWCLWCVSWLPGAVVSLCTLQLNEPISRGQRPRLRGDVVAFMSRHQEELDSYEIQMGFCHRWLCSVFTLTTRRSLWHLGHNSSQ